MTPTTDLTNLPPYLTGEQLGEVLGVNARTLWRWATKGMFPKPALNTERIRRWHRDTVLAHLNQQQTPAMAG